MESSRCLVFQYVFAHSLCHCLCSQTVDPKNSYFYRILQILFLPLLSSFSFSSFLFSLLSRSLIRICFLNFIFPLLSYLFSILPSSSHLLLELAIPSFFPFLFSHPPSFSFSSLNWFAKFCSFFFSLLSPSLPLFSPFFLLLFLESVC